MKATLLALYFLVITLAPAAAHAQQAPAEPPPVHATSAEPLAPATAAHAQQAPVEPPPARATPAEPPANAQQAAAELPPVHAVPAEPPPSAGLGHIIVGGIFTGGGAAHLLSLPLCVLSPQQPSTQKTCFALSLAAGVGFAAIGVSFLVEGVGRRNQYREWKKRNNAIGKLTDFGVAPAAGGVTVKWQSAF